jgi:hypothetical protein
MKKILILLLTCYSVYAYSQEIVFSQNVKSDTVRPTQGPNLKNYKHMFLGIGFPLTTADEVAYTKAGSSLTVDYGIRYKRRLNNTFAVGFDVAVIWAAYKIKQETGKSIPDTIINKRAKFKVNSLTPDLYLRINVGRRGNYIGKYLDLGGYGSWNWKKAYVIQNKDDNDQMVKVSTSRLSYMENFSYGLLARIGVNRLSVAAKYRLSDLFKDQVYSELPRFSVGVEFALPK